jgi:hypothetical protein
VADRARYLYAVTRGVTTEDLAGHTGLDDRPLEVVAHRGLDAVVSDVDLAEFDEDALRTNLEDLTWLERVARGHDEVVRAVAERGPTAPLRLATVCLADAGVRRRLDEWHDALVAALDRVEGRAEWSVKVVEPERAQASDGERDDVTGPGAGAAYLLRKRQATERRAQDEEAALRRADDVYHALAAVAVAGRRLRPQDARLSGLEGTMTLNAAFLVDDQDAATFAGVAQELAGSAEGAEVLVAGPWPPYSFATLEDA